MDRGPETVEIRALFRSDQRVQVVRLEVVWPSRGESKEIQNGTVKRGTGVQMAIVCRNRQGRGETARADASDRPSPRGGRALGDQLLCDHGTVLDVHHAPLLAQSLAVGASESRRATVVDLRHGDASRGEVGDFRVESK